MTRRAHPFATVIGIASGLAVGWAMYHMLLVGSCSTPAGPGEVECPPEMIRYVIVMVGGILVGVFGTAVGGSRVGFMSVFGGIGLAGVLAGMRPASEGGEAWFVFFGLCFLLTPLISLLAMPFKGMKRLKASRLMSQGIAATGTLLEVQDTGVTINANPRVRLRFRIEANGDYPMPPFEAEKTATIPRVMQPRVGDRFPVWVDQEDPSKWMFATTPEGAPSAQTPSLRRVIQLARHGAAPAVPAPPGDVVGELNKLNALRLAGKISSDEFAARTSDLIASG